MRPARRLWARALETRFHKSSAAAANAGRLAAAARQRRAGDYIAWPAAAAGARRRPPGRCTCRVSAALQFARARLLPPERALTPLRAGQNTDADCKQSCEVTFCPCFGFADNYRRAFRSWYIPNLVVFVTWCAANAWC